MKEKNFKFKKSYAKVIKDMTDKQAGEFIKGVCEYAFNGKPFQTKDAYLKGAFLFVQRELDVSAMNAANGKKGAEKLAEKRSKQKSIKDIGVLLGSVLVCGEGQPRDTKKDAKNG